MKIATYNVNSVRKRLDAVTGWLAAHQPDVLCLQETKVVDSGFPLESLQRNRLSRDLPRHERLQQGWPRSRAANRTR